MRLIDADAFKKWLLENSINEREEKESRQIGIWIDAFPSAQPEPHWIPCTKEYPEPWELVWTTDKHGNVEVCQLLRRKDSDWYDADEKWFYRRDSIIAWMLYEVPEPYQPEEESE